MAKAKTKAKVKASPLFMATRFACLPTGLCTPEQFRDLKSGEAVSIEEGQHSKYFVKESDNGNS